jgi:hypothetical protein
MGNPLHRSKPSVSSRNLVKFHQRRKHWMKLDLVFKGIGSKFFVKISKPKKPKITFKIKELNNTGLNFEPLSTLIFYK